MEPIDIFITTYERQQFSRRCVDFLRERTRHPFRLFIIDNGGNSYLKDYPGVFLYISLSQNIGIHAAWNLALSLAGSKYFVTLDPDLLAPDLEPDWLSQLVDFMEQRQDYAAISLHPHIFIGAAGIDPNSPEDVIERNMCGAVFRIMRTQAVAQVGGWEHKIEAGRNHEERTICSRLQSAGYKVGITARLRAYHMFGDNWGYPEWFTPEMQKHNPELKDYVKQFDHEEAYDPMTWLPK